ncbi:MAG: tetratricopeptide repeat protein, partial [Planctomycetaceae bacterium]|nr:tetratricopeptide repeat protein [Planctomycetaceae bacterium]
FAKYNNRGEEYRNQGEYEKALEQYNKALALLTSTKDKKTPKAATLYNNIGLATMELGDLDEAMDWHQKALEIFENKLGEEHASTAMSYNNIGLIYRKQNNLKKAESFYKKSLEIRKKLLGENHPDIANSYNNLAVLYHVRKKYKLAIEFILKAYKIRLDKLGKNHAETKDTLKNLKTIYGFLESEQPFSEWLDENLEQLNDEQEIEIEKPKKTKKSVTKHDFEKFSIEIPKGWKVNEDEDNGVVAIQSPNEKAGIMVTLTYSEDMDSEEFIETILNELDDSDPPKKVKNTGFYKATFRNENKGEGTMFAGTKNDLGDVLVVGGNHSDLHSILRSIKSKDKRPYLDKMIDAAIANLKSEDEPEPNPTPKPQVTKLNLPEFSVEIPKNWKTQTDKNTGLVSLTSADNKAALAILLSASEGLESKEWMDSVLSTFQFSDTAEPVKGGYYKSDFTNPNRIKGFIVAGAKNNLADTITVMGKHPALNQILLSIKPKQKRPYLDKIISDITGKKTNKKISVDEDENENTNEDEIEIDEDDKPKTEKKPNSKKEKKTTINNLESHKVDFMLREIRDPQLNNELAVTIAVPDGWQIKDTNIVQWNPLTYADPARIAFTLNEPEDETQCDILSPLSFHYDYGILSISKLLDQKQKQVYQQALQLSRQTGISLPSELQQPQIPEYKEHAPSDGRIIKQPTTAENFIKWLINQDKEISNVKIQKIEKPKLIVAELEKALPELNKQLTELLRQSGSSVQFKGVTADTALVYLTCSKNGKHYEQRICVVITYMRMASPCNIITNTNDESVIWTVTQLNSAYALAGKLKDHEVEIATILGESKINPVWKAKVEYLVAETIRKIAESRLKSQTEIQKQMLETQNYIAQTRQEVFRNKSNALSRTSEGMTNVLSGREVLRTPNGNNYRVPIGVFNSNNLPNGYELNNWAK